MFLFSLAFEDDSARAKTSDHNSIFSETLYTLKLVDFNKSNIIYFCDIFAMTWVWLTTLGRSWYWLIMIDIIMSCHKSKQRIMEHTLCQYFVYHHKHFFFHLEYHFKPFFTKRPLSVTCETVKVRLYVKLLLGLWPITKKQNIEYNRSQI